MEAEAASGPADRRGDARGSRAGLADLAAIFALCLLGGTWTWWAVKEGAYFGSVLYPGLFLLSIGTVVLVTTAPWRASLALSGPARLALWSLVGLAGWSLASALWSPTPDVAVADAQRMVGYALAFGLGIWACTLLGRRMELSVLPVVGAAAIAGLVTIIGLSKGADPATYLNIGGTVEYPLGYRNAVAAFFLIAFWPSICLAASERIALPLRAGAFITATACIDIAILCQSRGAIIAVAAGIAAYLAMSQRRYVALAWLGLAVLPAIPAFARANSLFTAAGDAATRGDTPLAGTLDEMNAAGSWALVSLVASAAIFFLARALANRAPKPSRGTVVSLRIVIAAAIGVAVIAVTASGWVGEKIDQCKAGEADLSQSGSRFTFDAGSNRCKEVWPSAVRAVKEDPIFGLGGGGFQFWFNKDREDPSQLARDAHSVELEMLSELGVVGLALFGAVVVGAFAGAMRSRRLGPASAQLSCAAVAAGSYWLVHSSVDWFWPYPAVTAPILALLGSAAAPALLMPERRRAPTGRTGLLVAVVFFAVTVVPPFLSERLTEQATESFRVNTEGAYDDLRLARDLNPLSDQPALAEGVIAEALDDRERAIDAFRDAVRKRPQEYTGHVFLALLYAETDPELARSELTLASELNPLTPRIDQIRARIEKAERRGASSRSRSDR